MNPSQYINQDNTSVHTEITRFITLLNENNERRKWSRWQVSSSSNEAQQPSLPRARGDEFERVQCFSGAGIEISHQPGSSSEACPTYEQATANDPKFKKEQGDRHALALHQAINEADLDNEEDLEKIFSMISSLKNEGGHLDIQDAEGYTLLHNVIISKSLERLDLIKSLLEGGADANIVHPESGRTLLHLAAESGQPLIVGMLINHKADINVKDNNGLTPRQVAKKSKTTASGYKIGHYDQCIDLLKRKPKSFFKKLMVASFQ